MNPVSIERFVEMLDCDVYPVTILKFLLNRRRIISYFSKVANQKVKIEGTRYKLSPDDCEMCKSKEDQGMLCRQHTSIDRVMTANKVAFDVDTNTFLYKNEIFRNIDGNLVIFYCPHPKLISGRHSDSKVRRVNITTVDDPAFVELPTYKEVFKFVSTGLMEKNMKCWFNNEFSIVTIPDHRNHCNWCLVPNY